MVLLETRVVMCSLEVLCVHVDVVYYSYLVLQSPIIWITESVDYIFLIIQLGFYFIILHKRDIYLKYYICSILISTNKMRHSDYLKVTDWIMHIVYCGHFFYLLKTLCEIVSVFQAILFFKF